MGRGGLAGSELLLLPLVCDAEIPDEDFSLAGEEIIDEHSEAFRFRNSSAADEFEAPPVGVLLEVTPLALAHRGPTPEPPLEPPCSSEVDGEVEECGIALNSLNSLDSSNFVLETAEEEIEAKFAPPAATAAAWRCNMKFQASNAANSREGL